MYKKKTYESAFGFVNGDFILRRVTSPDLVGFAQGSVGSSGRPNESFSFF
ncbi:hypothetical protein Hanom_Chr03g00213701 [Helianthus anomalus]